MPQPGILLLSRVGHQKLRRLLRPAKREVLGTLLSYDTEGIWFQDGRLERENKILLVKWSFIDAILSDLPAPEPERAIGFHPTDLVGTE